MRIDLAPASQRVLEPERKAIVKVRREVLDQQNFPEELQSIRSAFQSSKGFDEQFESD